MTRTTAFAIFLLVSLAILGGMHFYLWARLVRDPILAEPWRRVATFTLVVLALSVPAGMLSFRLAPRPLDRIVPAAAFTWLGLAFLLFCAVAALDLARLAAQGAIAVLEWLRSTPDPPADPQRRLFLARTIAGTAVAAAGGASALAFRSATGPALVTEVPVRLKRLPPRLSGFAIAQITDLHVGPTVGERTVRRVVEQVNALRPDLVAITGDLVDGTIDELRATIARFGALRARHGVFFVTGNHEYYTASGVEAWLAELRRLGIRVLRNERLRVGDAGASFDLAGVDDWSAPEDAPLGDGTTDEREANRLRLARALDGREPDRSLVLLAHQPRVTAVAEAVRAGVELQISGHTHGGQIAPFGLLVSRAFPYLKGLYRHEEGGRSGQVFVSRGTGYWGPPMRLGSPPEIAKIVLTA